jgi:hypothetical protein
MISLHWQLLYRGLIACLRVRIFLLDCHSLDGYTSFTLQNGAVV